MLKNASFLAIVAVDTAENEPLKIWGDLFSYSVIQLPPYVRRRRHERPAEEAAAVESSRSQSGC